MFKLPRTLRENKRRWERQPSWKWPTRSSFNFLIKMSIVRGSLLKLKWKWLRNQGWKSDWDEPNATKRALGCFNRIQPEVPISYLEIISIQTLGCEKHLHKCLCYDQKQHWYTLLSATTMGSSSFWEQWSPTALVGGQAWGIIIVVTDLLSPIAT